MARIVGKGYSYDDVLMVPKYNKIRSRKEVDFTTRVTRNYSINIPIIAANMDTVCEAEMAITLGKMGGLGVIHRFLTIEEQVAQVRKVKQYNLICAAAIGIKDYEERMPALAKAGVNIVVLDIAHGHSKYAGKTLEWIKTNFPSVDVMCGNIATKDAAEYFLSKGADAVKVGIGPGCLSEGTRILMSNGSYKNIEDVEKGDKVINMYGKPVIVLKKINTGVREVKKIKSNSFYEDTYITPEHRIFVGDLNSTSKKTTQSKGYKKILEKTDKENNSKYKWKEIQFLKNDVLLMPKKINFELEKESVIELKKRDSGNKKENITYRVDSTLVQNYSLGYLFGTFLGDGHSATTNYKNSRRGSVHWYFGANEEKNSEKLKKIIFEIFGKECKIKYKKNLIQITLHYKPLADFLENFGKRENKHLPEQYLTENTEYLKGLFDGLLDSDGHIEKDTRINFTNTSKQLIELFDILTYLLNDYFPNNLKHAKSQGGLLNLKMKNIKQSYRARTLKSAEKRLTEDFQIIKMIKKEDHDKKRRVYDLEVDCPTHSFIANNMIVHNSMCTTRIMSGAGVPQITAIMDVYEAIRGEIPICADGGIRYPGDIVKAIGAGADNVMLGFVLAGTTESPGKILKIKGKLMKEYRGMASYDATIKKLQLNGEKKEVISVEGEATKIDYKGPVEPIIKKYIGGLASGMTYVGAENMKKIIGKADFISMTSAGRGESVAHGKRD